ncbi:MAG: hypothetical protein JNJ40_09265 [Bacteroidia bacterium]|nr:hypothetical protein [Bacteroidia bacterium]
MVYKITVSTIYESSLDRVFKTPMLCDITKVHTGFGLMPKIISVSDDENWGLPGSAKKVYAAKSISQKGGFISMDKVIERRENEYWKIEVYDFQSWMMGFYKFTGEWETKELEPNKILVNYTYSLHSSTPLLYPFNWLFAKTLWKIYMKKVLENIRKMASNNEPYQYI